MNKIAGIAILVAAFLAPTQAHAGQNYPAPVIVNLQAQFAVGSLGSARNSKDDVQSIGCGFLAGGGHYSGSCYARDADGNYGTCSFFDDLGLALALAQVNGDSYIRFDWDPVTKRCTGINVTNASTMEPKKRKN